MPSILTMPEVAPVSQSPPRKRWTRSDYAALEATGIWKREHLELVEGELISKMGKNRPHSNASWLMATWLIRVFGIEYVHHEVPIDVASADNPVNEPEPDLIVLSRPHLEFRTENPGPADLRLVVEVSDTTLAFDLTTKAALYGRAGIAEYWVLDIYGRRLIVHRDPSRGKYESVIAYSEGESVAPLAAPEAPFPVATAFAAEHC